MAIFDNIFGNSSSEAKKASFNWINLDQLEQLETLEASSEIKPVVIFKHSTRCSVSRMALKQFENEFKPSQQTECYLLDLLNHRNISDRLTQDFSVPHQSPQVLVIRQKKCIYSVSHSDIDAEDIEKKL